MRTALAVGLLAALAALFLRREPPGTPVEMPAVAAARATDVVTREGTFRDTNPDSKKTETALATITICSPEQKSLRLRYIV